MGLVLLLLLGLLGLSTGGSEMSGSREAAGATATQANLKQLVNAIESCAASRIDGSYTGPIAGQPGVEDCLDPKTLVEYEKGLEALKPATTVPSHPGQYQVAPIGSEGQSYMVQGTSATSHDKLAYFAELHAPDGSLYKFCGAEPIDPDATQAPPVDSDLDDCDDGTWG